LEKECTNLIPIFIITCDRLEVLKKSMKSYSDYIKSPFEIVICDQGSTFKPMIGFLKELESSGVMVYRWKENLNDGIKRNLPRNDVKIRENMQNYFQNHPKSNYVVTDPDIFLDNVDGDILEVYAHLLNIMPKIFVVGPIFRIDDIPDYYPQRERLLFRYADLHSRKVNIIQYKDKIVKYVLAPIHTSFGMYRREYLWIGGIKSGIRTLSPYLAKHLDWYIGPKNLSEDQKYYMNHASVNAHWSTWEMK